MLVGLKHQWRKLKVCHCSKSDNYIKLNLVCFLANVITSSNEKVFCKIEIILNNDVNIIMMRASSRVIKL